MLQKVFLNDIMKLVKKMNRRWSLILVNLLSGPIESCAASFNGGVILDIAILFILFLFALINCIKGFTKQIFKIVASVGSLVIAYFFCGALLEFLNDHFDLTAKLANSLYGALADKVALVIEPTLDNISEAIISAGLPEFVANYAEVALAEATAGSYESIAAFLSELIANHILTAASFVALWIVSKLVLMLIGWLLSKVIGVVPIVRSVDRILGLLLGVIKALILVYVLLYVIEILPDSITVVQTLQNCINESVVGVFLSENNVFQMIISSVII